MTDKKLTDSAVIETFEKIIDILRKTEVVVLQKEPIDDLIFHIQRALDLINRLQAKAIKEQNKNSKLRNERNRLQSQNKDLSETVHNLTIEKDALFDKAEELKAEIERLKTNLNVELENFATEYDNKIKAEAYKEFAERLKTEYAKGMSWFKKKESYYVNVSDIDNLLKELMGENNDW